jgi:hypothetical protein
MATGEPTGGVEQLNFYARGILRGAPGLFCGGSDFHVESTRTEVLDYGAMLRLDAFADVILAAGSLRACSRLGKFPIIKGAPVHDLSTSIDR